MYNPKLSELPASPSGKIGWPWTEECLQLPNTMPDGSPWPCITVVTPSYNQGQYLEETIRSVLLQGYPNLEYIIIDGGSTDNSVNIISNYDRWITYWVSEQDRGQAHAINKGFAKAKGDLFGWINSDDILLPKALWHFAVAFQKNPEVILLGDVIHYREQFGISKLMCQKDVAFENIVDHWRNNTIWQQPGTYFPQTLYQKVGPLDETFCYVFDWDWICRALQIAKVHYLGVPVARFRHHSTSKTIGEAVYWFDEEQVVIERYQNQLKNSNPKTLKADFELHMASTFLRLQNWNRRKGMGLLCSAISNNWRVTMTPGFISLLARALTPIFFLKISRYLHHMILARLYTK